MALPVIKAKVTADTAGAEAGFDRVGDSATQMGNEVVKAGKRVEAMGAQMRGAQRTSGGFGRGVQNAAFQVGDFAVQVGAGTDATRALAMQLPQLLGGFGVLGAVAGAAVAIIIPLRSAMQGLSDDGREMSEVFGTLQPVMQGIASAFASVGEIARDAAELIVNNIDRIIVIAGTAAALFAGKWVAGFVAARAATFSLSAALVTLRGALIKTGIGALIVAAGELVFRFTKLVEATGSVSNAIAQLGVAAKLIFENMRIGVSLLGEAFGGAAMYIKGVFLGAFASIASGFASLTQTIAGGFNSLFGTNISGIDVGNIGAQADFLKEGGKAIISSTAESYRNLKSVREVLAGMKDDKITLPDILGLGEDGEGGGGGGGKTLKEKLSDQESAIRDHVERIRALTQGGLSGSLGAWGDYFDNLFQMTGTSNKRVLGLVKAFNSAQALMDAWGAYNRVLNSPEPMPWWARLAAGAQVLAAGLGAVNAINSVTGSGGGGGGGAGAPTAAAGGGAAAAPTTSRNVAIQFSGGGMFSQEQVVGLINQINEAVEDGAIIRVV